MQIGNYDIENTPTGTSFVYRKKQKGGNMKVRDLLRKIVNGEDLPKIIAPLEEALDNKNKEIERLNNIIENIDTYIHLWKLDEIGEKTMLILNDILLIKNGMSDEVIRLKEVNKE